VLGYTIHPGNEHDSRTFPAIYERLKKYDPTLMVLDAGYKTPAIAKTLLDDGIKPVYPYRRSMTKKGVF
jgi:rhodanese-related sulfurtransferase